MKIGMVRVYRRVGKVVDLGTQSIVTNDRTARNDYFSKGKPKPRDNQKKEIWMNLQELMPPQSGLIINCNNGYN